MSVRQTYEIDVLSAEREDALRNLARWLRKSEIPTQIMLVESDPRPGQLGGVLDAIVATIGSGAAITGLTGALVAWIRSRSSELDIKITRPDGTTVEISGKQLRKIGIEDVPKEIDRISRSIQKNEQS
jgi:hypothetical protein